MSKFLIFVEIVLVCHVFGLHKTLASEDCCPNLGSFNDELFCADGTAAAPFCGIGACDSEGCNCKGGCRSDLDFGENHEVADYQAPELEEYEDPGHDQSAHEHSGQEHSETEQSEQEISEQELLGQEHSETENMETELSETELLGQEHSETEHSEHETPEYEQETEKK